MLACGHCFWSPGAGGRVTILTIYYGCGHQQDMKVRSEQLCEHAATVIVSPEQCPVCLVTQAVNTALKIATAASRATPDGDW